MAYKVPLLCILFAVTSFSRYGLKLIFATSLYLKCKCYRFRSSIGVGRLKNSSVDGGEYERKPGHRALEEFTPGK